MRSLLLVCLVSSLFGQSAQSPPQRKEPAKDEGREVAAKKNDGQNLPSGAGSSKGQFNTADQNQKSDTSNQGGKTDLDGWMIGLTAGLVLVGAGQVWVLVRQTSILDRGLAETRTATVLTRKSLVLTQRPRLTIRNIVLDEPNYSLRFLAPTSKDPTFMPGEVIKGNLSLANTGNGEAIIRNTYFRIAHWGEPERLPMRWPYDADKGGILCPDGIELHPGQATECSFSGIGPSIDQITHAGDPDSGKLNMYVLGRVEYADELGLIRRMVFCRRYHRGFDKFVRVRDPDYENAD